MATAGAGVGSHPQVSVSAAQLKTNSTKHPLMEATGGTAVLLSILYIYAVLNFDSGGNLVFKRK